MNLAEALNAALPDLPARRVASSYAKVDPSAVVRENIEDGDLVIVVLNRSTDKMFRFKPEQWRIVELFDGTRSYAEVASLHKQLYGIAYSVDDLQEFASGLDEADFWYKTPLERSIALRQKLESTRHQHAHKKSRWGDVAHMQFSAWDPDYYFNRIYPSLKWVYSRWFTILTLILFAIMLAISIANVQQIGRDTIQFYTFTQKSAADLAEFWIIFLILGFLHESAHGLTCKHYGGEVHAMGFHLIYLTPAFFVDVSEAWVYASRWQRFVTIIAGIWVELILCAIATIIWWGTPPGSDVHNFSYTIMLLTGAAVVVINMNPLIKLDGYYAFSEIIGFSDIKEKSTAYLSGLIRHRFFHLPVEMEYVPRRRRTGFIIYAILSGIYSYGLLYAVVRFSFNVFSKYSPQWACVPALTLALIIFRTRIRTLLRFVRTVYLDKRERVRSWLARPHVAVAIPILLIILFAPLWRETVTARFILEPVRREVVKTIIPGRITAIYVGEGQPVTVGQPLVQMDNTQVRSHEAVAQQDFKLTGLKGIQAQLQHDDRSQLLPEHARAGIQQATAREEVMQLEPAAPIAGIVMSSHPENLLGSYLDAGTVIAEIGETSQMRARIFVLEYAIPQVNIGASVRLLEDGKFMPAISRVVDLQPAPEELAPSLDIDQKINAGSEIKYYVAEAIVPNDGSLREGMIGTAKIFVQRRSLVGFFTREVREFFDRKIW